MLSLSYRVVVFADFNFPFLFYKTSDDFIKLLNVPMPGKIDNKLSFRDNRDRYPGFIDTI